MEKSIRFGLREVVPRAGGNTGIVTLHIYGAGFVEITKVFLIDKTGKKIDPVSVQHYKLDALKCVFDLQKKPVGIYDVVEFKGKEYKLEK
ncbi:MAG: hypothetical protein N2560_02480 [Ignavibacteria bacterium]|nr:hypothetical protein [Ignavibacteria bacterium]